LGDELLDGVAPNLARVRARDGLAVAIGEERAAMSDAPIITRDQWLARNTRPKRKTRPELRKRRVPTGPCRVCDHRATKYLGHTPLCGPHFTDAVYLVNHGVTAAVTVLVEDGTLREKLKARHAAKWDDRP
jgi:hypothetical protein